MEAVMQEDLLECGHVINRAPHQWHHLRESYERYWSQPSELDQLRHQLQQAEARVAELGRLNNNLGDALVSHIEYESQQADELE